MLFSNAKTELPYIIGSKRDTKQIIIKPGENNLSSADLAALKNIPMFARNIEKGRFQINPSAKNETKIEKKTEIKDKGIFKTKKDK